jgi:hypothetical protein
VNWSEITTFFHDVPAPTVSGAALIVVGSIVLGITPWIQGKRDRQRSKNKQRRLGIWFAAMLILGALMNAGGTFLIAKDSLVIGLRISKALAKIDEKLPELPADSPQLAAAKQAKDEIEALAKKLAEKRPDAKRAVSPDKLGPASLEERISNNCRPVLQRAVDIIRHTAEVHGTLENKAVAVKVADCPENVCKDYSTVLGSVQLTQYVQWDLEIVTSYPLDARKPVQLWITLTSKGKSPHGKGRLKVNIWGETNEFSYDTTLYDLPAAITVTDKRYSTEKFDESFREVIGVLADYALLFPD